MRFLTIVAFISAVAVLQVAAGEARQPGSDVPREAKGVKAIRGNDEPKGLGESILGAWTCWNPQTRSPNVDGLLSIAFLRNKKVEWATRVDGKTASRTGTYDIEASENLFHPSSSTHMVRLHRDPLPKSEPVSSVLKATANPIHLVNVRVGDDNRFPSGTMVLKFRDAYYSELVCTKKEIGQQADER